MLVIRTDDTLEQPTESTKQARFYRPLLAAPRLRRPRWFVSDCSSFCVPHSCLYDAFCCLFRFCSLLVHSDFCFLPVVSICFWINSFIWISKYLSCFRKYIPDMDLSSSIISLDFMGWCGTLGFISCSSTLAAFLILFFSFFIQILTSMRFSNAHFFFSPKGSH